VNRLRDKVIVVIGGTSGIGLASAQRFLAEGAQLISFGLPQSLETAKNQTPAGIHWLVGDALLPESAQQCVDLAVANYGRLDALFHVAGGSGRKAGDGPLHSITDEGWNYTNDLNLRSVFYSNRAALNQFLKQKSGGAILNLSSVLACSPSPQFFSSHAYAAAKAGIIGMSRAAAAHYAPHNIRINVLAPGLVDTPMATRALENSEIMNFVSKKQPLDGGRPASPNDISDAALFLLSDESKFVTGQVFTVDGGWSVTEGR
jgi:NAD(P)-dependent dehydrogenase (short-subunit alcohol dehydrogenase family)